MTTALTIELLGQLIDSGYAYCLVKEQPLENVEEVMTVLCPVRSKPYIAHLPEGYHTYYRITREPLQMAKQEQQVLVDLTEIHLLPDMDDRLDEFIFLNEQFFQHVIESLEDYVLFTMDTEGTINSWNTGAKNILQYETEEIIGQSGAIIFTPEDQQRKAHLIEIKTALDQGRAINERFHVRKDMSKFWGSGIVFPVYDQFQNHIGFTKVMRNLTERQDARQKAEDAKFYADSVISMAREPLLVLNADHTINTVNDCFLEQFGLHRREVERKSLFEILNFGSGENELLRLFNEV